jgi:hypothetical protein
MDKIKQCASEAELAQMVDQLRMHEQRVISLHKRRNDLMAIVEYIKANLAEYKPVEAAFRELLERFGRLDDECRTKKVSELAELGGLNIHEDFLRLDRVRQDLKNEFEQLLRCNNEKELATIKSSLASYDFEENLQDYRARYLSYIYQIHPETVKEEEWQKIANAYSAFERDWDNAVVKVKSLTSVDPKVQESHWKELNDLHRLAKTDMDEMMRYKESRESILKFNVVRQQALLEERNRTLALIVKRFNDSPALPAAHQALAASNPKTASVQQTPPSSSRTQQAHIDSGIMHRPLRIENLWNDNKPPSA